MSTPFFWLSILWLTVLALAPLSTAFYGDYPDWRAPALLFHLHFFILWAVSWCHVHYGITRGLLDEQSDIGPVVLIRQRIMIPLVVAVLAALAALASPAWSAVTYLLIPVGNKVFARYE